MRVLKPLPLLDGLTIATPCRVEWASMTGDERTRYCSVCDQNVHNIVDMTREDAEALLRRRDGRLCARIFVRHDGTVLTRDCPVGVGDRLRKRVALIISTAAAMMIGVIGLIAARPDARRTPHEAIRQHPFFGDILNFIDPPPRCIAGDIAPPEPKEKPPNLPNSN